MYVLYCMHLYHVILGLASFLLQPASGSEFKLNEAPKIDLSKAEEDWAKILHGPGPGPCAEPGSDCAYWVALYIGLGLHCHGFGLLGI